MTPDASGDGFLRNRALGASWNDSRSARRIAEQAGDTAGRSERWQLQPPVLALPTGGGAIRGMGEAFTATVTGGAALTVPLGLPQGRCGFTPGLGLSYHSNGGNGPYGLGWNIGAGQVARRVEAGVPRYHDDDQLIIDGAEIVPRLGGDGTPLVSRRTVYGRNYLVRQYRPRVGNGHSRIERWTNSSDPTDDSWRVISPVNTMTWYGRDAQSRIADPADRSRIAIWLPCLSHDDRGNACVYAYAAEDSVGIADSLDEAGRTATARSANRYLTYVRYGNLTAYKPLISKDGAEPPLPDQWMFHLVLDYGDHDDSAPGVEATQPWAVRPDPFSTYRYGFEIRTYRRCRRALIFHQFPELGSDPVLVSETELTYRADEDQVVSMLASVRRTGHGPDAAGQPAQQSLPSLDLSYSPWLRSAEPVAVPRSELTGDPVGLDGIAYEWADLNGDGAAGVLARRGEAWYYKRNLSPLTHLDPAGPSVVFAPAVAVPQQPAGLIGQAPSPLARRPVLADIDGDGQLDLLTLDVTGGGAVLRSGDEWQPYRPFPTPAPDTTLARTMLIDLTGNGVPDLLLIGDSTSRWHEGLGVDGFGPPRAVRADGAADDPDGELRALQLAAGGETPILLADMAGDGLMDLVVVTRTCVSYWPNLGHGRFGHRVVMRDTPVLDAPDAFDPARVILADVDGSGPADLVYLGDDDARLYRNLAGNGWSEPIPIDGAPAPDRMTSAAVIDLFGRGTGCLVWSTHAPRPDGLAMHYVDLAVAGKPYLLSSYDGGLGGVVRLDFTPSTAYALADALAGQRWVTRLPFPVHCLSRIITTDAVRGTTFTTTRTYHHGHFDGREREFRGFGRIDTRDAESYLNGPHDVPPVLTRTWFHTGAALGEGEMIQHAFRHEYAELAGISLPEPQLPPGLDPDTVVDAARALAGVGLRSEVFAEDGTDQEAAPFTVTESTYDVRLIQPARDGAPPAFRVDASAQVGYGSERDLDDPRVTQALILAVDDLGLVTRSAVVAHPRRSPDASLPGPVQAAQARSVITYTDHALTADIDGPDTHRLRVVHDSRGYELTGIQVIAGTAVTAGDITAAIPLATDLPEDTGVDPPSPPGVTKRLLAHRQVEFLADDLTSALPQGIQASHGLARQSYRLALTPELRTARLGTAVSDADLLAAGYVHRGDDAWWVQSGRWTFPADAADHFLLGDGAVDALGATVSIEWLHDYLVSSVTNARGHRNSATYDLRTLAPSLVTDPNGNRSAVRFDPLGCVIASAMMGKDGAGEGDTLDDPTARMEYDLDRWRTSGLPAVVKTIAREQFGAANTRFFESRAYLDGNGTVVATKSQAKPGIAKHYDAATGTVTDVDTTPQPRWIGTGRTVVNNKGLPVLAFEPYYTDTPEYDDAAALVQAGVSDVTHYDALGRTVRVDHPDGTFGRVEFGPWGGIGYDAIDTALDSQWYIERGSPDPAGPEPADPEQRAAWLAAGHANTPTKTYLDVIGRPVFAIADDGNDGVRTTRAARDLTSMVTHLHDNRDRLTASQETDMLGRPMAAESAERGRNVVFPDVLGQVVFSVDALGRRYRLERDDLHRPTLLRCEPGNGNPSRVLTLTRYADDPARNAVGRVVQIYDQAGRIDIDGYDFTGAATGIDRRFTLDHTDLPDWSAVLAAQDPDAAGDQLLDAEVFHGSAEHDAAGRVTTTTLPDGSVVTPAYDQGSRLATIDVLVNGTASPVQVLTGRDHDAAGRPVRSQFGNGLETTYGYNDLTRRLTRAVTAGQAGPSLQDFSYIYDPLGNVTTVDDAAQQTVFFANAVVTARRDFSYDALSQLVRATGRELAALSQPDNTDAPVRPLPDPGDTAAVRQYTEHYTYDDLGNLMTVTHRAGANGWTRRHRYTYQADPADRTNRLDATSIPGDQDGMFSAAYHHDGLGNIDATPQIAALRWDLLNRLAGVGLGGGGNAFYTYDVSGSRARKIIDRGGGLVLETLYLGAVEIVRRRRNGLIVSERHVLHISGDDGRIAQFDRVTIGDNAGPLPVPTLRYVHGDRLGSATLLTDEAGQAVCHEEFHPFGTTAYRSAAPSEDVSLSRYRFCDRERDDETGCHLMGLRYYAPWLGRWLSPDPVGYADGFNLYRYSHNNPSTLCDPSGMKAKRKRPHSERIVPPDVHTESQFEEWAVGAGIWYTGKPRHDETGWHVGEWGRYPAGEGGGQPRGGPVARPPGDDPADGKAAGKGGQGDAGEGATAEGKGGEGDGNAKAPSDTGGGESDKGTGDNGPGADDAGAKTTPAAAPPANAPNADAAGGGGPSGEGAGQGGGAAAQAAPASEKFIWNYDFPGTGVQGTQRGRILEWLAGVPWRDNTASADKVTATAVQQIRSTSAYDTIGNFTRAATRDAQAYIAANPSTTTGLRPQAVIITPTDAPAQAGTDIADALNPGRGRRIPTGALPPEHVRGLPGPVGAVGTGLTIGGTVLAGVAFGYDIYRGDAPMAIGDGLSTAGGGLELYAIASPGATVAGVSAMSTGLVAGGAGIAIASGISAYRAYQRGDTAGVAAGLVGVAAGLAIMLGVIFGAPLLLIGGLVAAVGVGLFHLARWLL